MIDAEKMDIVPCVRTDITINLWAEELARSIQRFMEYWNDMRDTSDPQWYPHRLERGDWDEQFAEFVEGEQNDHRL